MDSETRAEFEEHSKKSPLGGGAAAAANPLSGFDMAGWMAGKTAPVASGGGGEEGQGTGTGAGTGRKRRG